MRTASGPGSPCQTEEPLEKGDISALLQGCLCAPALLPAQHAAQKLSVVASCVNPAGQVSQADSIATPLVAIASDRRADGGGCSAGSKICINSCALCTQLAFSPSGGEQSPPGAIEARSTG